MSNIQYKKIDVQIGYRKKLWSVSGMYRELVIRAYGEDTIKKIDQLRQSGINMTELVLSAVMLADIEKLREEKRKRLACV